MKKILCVVFALSFLLISGCQNEEIKNVNAPTEMNVNNSDSIIRIKGCQYIYSHSGNGSAHTYTHLGNCDNPIHYQNKKVNTVSIK